MPVYQEEKYFIIQKRGKAKIIEKYKVGDIIKGAEVKGYSSFGCFFSVNGELDVFVHLQKFLILELITLMRISIW